MSMLLPHVHLKATIVKIVDGGLYFIFIFILLYFTFLFLLIFYF